jgi:hypothetical protein
MFLGRAMMRGLHLFVSIASRRTDNEYDDKKDRSVNAAVDLGQASRVGQVGIGQRGITRVDPADSDHRRAGGNLGSREKKERADARSFSILPGRKALIS